MVGDLGVISNIGQAKDAALALRNQQETLDTVQFSLLQRWFCILGQDGGGQVCRPGSRDTVNYGYWDKFCYNEERATGSK